MHTQKKFLDLVSDVARTDPNGKAHKGLKPAARVKMTELAKDGMDKFVDSQKPVAARVENNKPDHFGSDCAMAGHHIGCAMSKGANLGAPEHPISLIRLAYGV